MTTPFDRVAAALADNYRLERELGQGGMATVYLAEDLKHHRQVAVKVLRPELAASLGPDRFFREIEVAARLQHPHILPLFDSGAAVPAPGAEPFLWYAMPFVDGETLRDRLARTGELPVHDAIRILIEVADALAHAHASGVAHRDIKPENILLSGRHALVSDFGVAKAVSEATGRQQLTTAGVALGTPAYMAPEQAAADPHLDHRVDIYALGVLAYELLTGRTPFSGRTPQETLAAHVMQTPEPVSRLRPGISPAFEAIVMKCLAKRPADRFQSAEELVTALEPLATPSGGMTPTYTQPVTGVAPMAPAGRKRAVRAAALVIVLGSLGVLMTRRAGRGPEVSLTRTTRLTSAQGLEVLPAISPDNQFLAYTGVQGGSPNIYLQPTDGGRAINITEGMPGAQVSPNWSPDGRRLVFVSYDPSGVGILTMPPTGGDVRRLRSIPYDASVPMAPKWSPDGSRIAFEQGDSVLVMAADGTGLALLARVRDVHSLAWSPDGRWLAGVRGNSEFAYSGQGFGNLAASTVFVMPATGGTPVMVSDSTSLNLSPAWLPGGHALLYLSSGGGGRDIYLQRIGRRGTADGAPRRITTGLDAHTFALAPDGKRLAYSKYTRDLNIWMVRLSATGSVNARSAVPITRGNQASEVLRLSPDGKWLLYDSDLNGNGDLFVVPSDGGTPRQLTDDPADDLSPNWSPDASQIAFHSFRTGNRDVFIMNADGTGLAQVTTDTLSDWYAAWGPDNNTLAYARGEAPNIELVETRRDSPSSPWGPPTPLGRGVTAFLTPDRSAYLTWRYDNEPELTAVPSGGGAARVLFRAPPWFQPNWPQTGLRGQGLYSYSPDSLGVPAFWSIDTARGTVRRVVSFDATDPWVTRGNFDTDGSRFYFIAGEHQADIWVAEVEEK
ncbi:MAG TPA: protein kinase [Gemmatimonadales bacterium]|nr:protein kinase [Gemmatimonadales bacterium]